MTWNFRNKVSGLRSSLAFSNRWSLIAQRWLRPHDRIVPYLWRDRWWLVCDGRYQDAHAAKEVLAGGCYDEAILRSARGGQLTYVNLGANIGAFDIAVAGLVQSIPFACSVEMNPKTFRRLNFNLHLNDLESVKTLNAGVTASSGSLRFHASDCSLADSVFAPTPASAIDTNFFEVPMVTLEGALRATGVEKEQFDLLKIDCEGAEYSIIKETRTELLRQFAHIVVEIHLPPVGESHADFYQKLSEAGFETSEPVLNPPQISIWSRI